MADIGNVIKYNTVRNYPMSMPDQNGVRRPVIYNEIPDVTTKPLNHHLTISSKTYNTTI